MFVLIKQFIRNLAAKVLKNSLRATCIFLCLIYANVLLAQDVTVSITGTGILKENDSGKYIVTINLSSAITNDLQVTVNIAGDASLNSDFTISSNPITVAANQLFATATLTVLSDSIVEGIELIVLSLGTNAGAPNDIAIVNSLSGQTLTVQIAHDISIFDAQVDTGDAAINTLGQHTISNNLHIGDYVDAGGSLFNSDADGDDSNFGLRNIAVSLANDAVTYSSKASSAAVGSLINGRIDNGDQFATADAAYDYIGLDLQGILTVSGIVINNASFGINRANLIGSYLLVSSNAFTGGSTSAGFNANFELAHTRFLLDASIVNGNNIIRVRMPENTDARYIRIQSSTTGKTLHLNEIQVWANSAVNDEDAISNNSILYITANEYTVDIDVHNPTINVANLYAWLDIDSNDQYDNDEVETTTIAAETTTTVSVSWNSLADITLGETFVRFRLTTSSLGNASVFAGDGEVEDHIITVVREPVNVAITTISNGSENNANALAFTISIDRFFDGRALESNLTIRYTLAGLSNADDYTAIPTSTVFSGNTTMNTIYFTPVNDSLVEGNESLVITIESDNGHSQGLNLLYTTPTALAIIVDDDLATMLAINASANAIEGGTSGYFEFVSDYQFERDIYIRYTIGGGATNADYAAINNEILLAGGTTSSLLYITAIDDGFAELDESVAIRIIDIVGEPELVSINFPSAATILTIDDQNSPQLSLKSNINRINENATTSTFFIFTLDNFLSTNLTINYSIIGDASNGIDYATITSSVVLPAFATSVLVYITPTAEASAIAEGEEFIKLVAQTATGFSSGINLSMSASENSDFVGFFEDFAIFALPQDGGDAPSSFGVPLTSFNSDVRIGTRIDAELNIDFSPNSDNDDISIGGVYNAARGAVTTSSIGALNSPDLAVDGNMYFKINSGLFTIEDNGGYPYWQVDLGSEKSFSGIIIKTRNDDRTRFSNTYILLSATELTGDNTKSGFEANYVNSDYRVLLNSAAVDTEQIRVNLEGVNNIRYIKIQRGIPSNAIFQLQEVLAFVKNTPNPDDEDGVDFDNLTLNSLEYGINVNIENPVDEALNVYAWIDFNNNGVFEDDEASTATHSANTNGSARLEWEGISGLSLVNIFARIRITTDDLVDIDAAQDSRARTTSSDGEIEDYILPILPNAINVSITSTNIALSESASANNTKLAFELDSAFNNDVHIQFTVTGKEDYAEDYADIGTSLLIVRGTTEVSTYFIILDDNIVEAEETITILLETIIGDYSGITVSFSATGNSVVHTIADNDTQAFISLVSLSAVAEGSSGTPIRVELSKIVDFDLIYTQQVIAGGSAELNSDYSQVPISVLIPRKSTSVSVQFSTLEDIGNQIVEGVETALFSLVSITGAPAGTTITFSDTTQPIVITDNDTAILSISKLADTEENGLSPASLLLTLSNLVKTDFIVELTFSGTAQKGEDYANIANTLLFSSLTFTRTFDINSLNDDIVEGQETIDIRILRVLNAPMQNSSNLVSINSLIADVSIADDENLLNLSITTLTNASEGFDSGSFRVYSDKVVGFNLQVSYTADSSSTANSDEYQFNTDTSDFAVDSTSIVVYLVAIDDNESEFAESVNLLISTVSNIPSGIAVNFAANTVTMIITDEGDRTNTFRFDQANDVTEGENLDFIFTLSKSYNFDITVGYQLLGSPVSGVDFNNIPLITVVAANQTSKTVRLNTIADSVAEPNETIAIEFVTVTGDLLDSQNFYTDIYSFTSNTAVINNVNNDVLINLTSLGPAAENSTNIIYSFSLNRVSSEPISIVYSIVGSASSSDYTISPLSINYFANRTTPLELVINPINDLLIEGNETLALIINTVVSTHTNLQIIEGNIDTVTIIDNESLDISISAENITATESGGYLSYLVEFNEQSQVPVTLNYTLLGSAIYAVDYMQIPTVTVLEPNQTEYLIYITPTDDFIFEINETITLQLETAFTASNLGIGFSNDSATTYIFDDDSSQILIFPKQSSVIENNDAEASLKFSVQLTNPSNLDTTVFYSVTGSAILNQDYIFPSASVVIAANSTNSNLYITLLQDTSFEPRETILISLNSFSGSNGAVISNANTAIYTIIDDDIPKPTVAPTDGRQIEGTTVAGSAVLIEVFINSVLECSVMANLDGSFLCDSGLSQIPDSSVVSVFAVHIDALNIRSLATKVVVDVIAPVLTNAFANANSIIGVTEPGIAVRVYTAVNDDSTLLCSSTTNNLGNFVCNFNQVQTNNQITTLVVEDLAGNQSVLAVVVDAISPLPPTEVFSNANSVKGKAVFTGNIAVYLAQNDSLICETTVPINNNNFICNFTSSLAHGTQIYVQTLDDSANASNTIASTVDSITPATFDFADFYGLFLEGTTEPFVDVELQRTEQGSTLAITVCKITSNAEGKFRCDLEQPLQIPTQLQAIITDLSDNSSTPIAITYSSIPQFSVTVNTIELSQISVSITTLADFTVIVTYPDSSTRVAAPVNADRTVYVSQTESPQPTGKLSIVVVAKSLATSNTKTFDYIENLPPAPPAFSIEDRNDGLVKLSGTTEIARDNDTITVQVVFPSGSSKLTTANRETGSFTFTSDSLEGSGQVRVRAIDSANNIGDFAIVNYIENIQPPIDQIIVSGDNLGRVTVFGTTEANCQIVITYPDSSQLSTASNNSGKFSITTTTIQPSGILEIVLTDPYSNVNTLTVNYVETEPPNIPTATATGDRAGRITLNGTAESLNFIIAEFPDSSTATTQADVSGTYSLLSNPNQPSGSIRVFSRDLANNVSANVDISFLETVPPAPPEIAVTSDSMSKITITGVTEPGVLVTVEFPSRAIQAANANSNGFFIVESFADQPSGTITLTVRDTNSNVSDPLIRSYVETKPPAKPTANFIPLGNKLILVTGVGEVSSRMRVVWPDGVESMTMTNSVNGSYQLLVSAPAISGNVKIYNIDSAGNSSEPLVVLRDFEPPEVISAFITATYLIGSAESGATLTLSSEDNQQVCPSASVNSSGLFFCNLNFNADTNVANLESKTFTILIADAFRNSSSYQLRIGDQDNDSIADADEQRGPNIIDYPNTSGALILASDGNLDGLIDASQPNVSQIYDAPGSESLNNNKVVIALDSGINNKDYCKKLHNFTIKTISGEPQANTSDNLSNATNLQAEFTDLVDNPDTWHPYGVVDLVVACNNGNEARFSLYYYGHNQQKLGGIVSADYSVELLNISTNNNSERKFIILDKDTSKNVYLANDISEVTSKDIAGRTTTALKVDIVVKNVNDILLAETAITTVFPRIIIGLSLPEIGTALVKKYALREIASIGERVDYVVSIQNDSDRGLARSSLIDILPYGFRVPADSVFLSRKDQPIQPLSIARTDLNNPANSNFRNIIRTGLLELDGGEEIVIYYSAIVGSNVTEGVKVNSASLNLGVISISNISSASVDIRPSPFLQNSLILGRVFRDLDANGLQSRGETGVGGVRLATVQGEWITTDVHGKFNVPSLQVDNYWRGRNFILKLDIDSLPNSWKVVGDNPKVIRVSQGEIASIKFAISSPNKLYQSDVKALTRRPFKSLPITKKADEQIENYSLVSSLSKATNTVAEDLPQDLPQDLPKDLPQDLITYEFGTTQTFMSVVTYYKDRNNIKNDTKINKVLKAVNTLVDKQDIVSIVIKSYWDSNSSKIDKSYGLNSLNSSLELGDFVANYIQSNSKLKNLDNYKVQPQADSAKIYNIKDTTVTFESLDNDYGWGVFLKQYDTIKEGLNELENINFANIGILSSDRNYGLKPYSLFVGPFEKKISAQNVLKSFPKYKKTLFIDEVNLRFSKLRKRLKKLDVVKSRKLEIAVLHRPVTIIDKTPKDQAIAAEQVVEYKKPPVSDFIFAKKININAEEYFEYYRDKWQLTFYGKTNLGSVVSEIAALNYPNIHIILSTTSDDKFFKTYKQLILFYFREQIGSVVGLELPNVLVTSYENRHIERSIDKNLTDFKKPDAKNTITIDRRLNRDLQVGALALTKPILSIIEKLEEQGFTNTHSTGESETIEVKKILEKRGLEYLLEKENNKNTEPAIRELFKE